MRLGWARTRVDIRSGARVLDVGSGAFPNPRADVCCDLLPDDDEHRNGVAAVIDRPFVIGDVTALPFRDGAFDFVIASHIAEHVEDPAAFCAEMSRVATAGYIETPSPLGDRLLHEDYHLWRVGHRDGALAFVAKGRRRPIERWLTDAFYWVFNAGRGSGKPSMPLPGGRLGRVLRFPLVASRGVLNRTGVLVTRVHFGPDAPLRWRVHGEVAPVGRPSASPLDRTPPTVSTTA